MSYRVNCNWLYGTYEARKCIKEAFTMGHCPEDCPFFEKKILL